MNKKLLAVPAAVAAVVAVPTAAFAQTASTLAGTSDIVGQVNGAGGTATAIQTALGGFMITLAVGAIGYRLVPRIVKKLTSRGTSI